MTRSEEEEDGGDVALMLLNKNLMYFTDYTLENIFLCLVYSCNEKGGFGPKLPPPVLPFDSFPLSLLESKSTSSSSCTGLLLRRADSIFAFISFGIL